MFSVGMEWESLAKASAGLTIAVVLVALCSWVYEDVQSLRRAPVSPADTQSGPGGSSGVRLDALLAANIFGQADAAKPQSDAPTKVPETRLQLELKGVFSSTDPSASSALIAQKSQPAKYYRVGDQLPGGAELSAVASDHVKLTRSGIEEALSFSRPGSGLAEPSDDLVNLTQQASPNPVVQKMVGPDSNRSDSLRERLRQLRDVQREIQQQ